MLKEMIKLKSFLIMRKSNGILTLFIKRHQAIINILNHIEPIFKIVSRFGTNVHFLVVDQVGAFERSQDPFPTRLIPFYFKAEPSLLGQIQFNGFVQDMPGYVMPICSWHLTDPQKGDFDLRKVVLRLK